MRFILVNLLVAAVSCGTTSSSPNSGSSGSGGADGGAGSTGGGGSIDAGSGSSGGGGSAGGGTGGGGTAGGGSGGGGTTTSRLDVAPAGGGGGRILSSPAGIDCPGTCSASFDSGTQVTLNATPASGSRFSGWSGACSGTGACAIAMTANTSVGAVFEQLPLDECAGLGPEPVGAASGSAQLDGNRGSDCFTGPSDGAGIVALESQGRFDSINTFHLYDPAGAELGEFAGIRAALTEQLAGFIAGGLDGTLTAIDGRGKATASADSPNESYGFMTLNPLGGVVVNASPKGTDTTKAHFIVWFDEHLKERWRAPLPATDTLVTIGVDRQGNVLVLTDGQEYGQQALGGYWIDASGKAGEKFKASDVAASTLASRVGNGLFLQSGTGQWIAQFEPLGAPRPAPDWLAARPAWTALHMARNGRAYAVIPQTVDVENMLSCSTAVDIVASSGKSCGTAVFTASSVPRAPAPETDCRSGLVVGYDGTAIQQTAPTPAGNGTSSFTCYWQWWSGYFK